MKDGVCKLSGEQGKFVKSHLLPRAFTDLALSGPDRVEYGEGSIRPVLRRTSWFDDALVTRAGEDILAKIDSNAYSVTQRLGLSWRSRPFASHLSRIKIPNTDFELIEIPEEESKSLRLFALSLLWRAAFTERPEFRQIKLDAESRRRLTWILRTGSDGGLEFPSSVCLLTSVGDEHVHTPLRFKLPIADFGGEKYPDLKVFRFFLDGMIIYTSRKASDRQLERFWQRRILGRSGLVLALGFPYEESRQERMLNYFRDEMSEKFPDASDRIYGLLKR